MARPLSPAEQDEVDRWLRPEEVSLFWSQQPADQRHALATARRLAVSHPEDTELIRAGLLHDVGKTEVRISAFGRTWATLGDLAGLPLPDRYRKYRNHGEIGGRALAEVGAEPLVVAFATLHPYGPPDGVSAGRWQLLLDADDD